MALTCCLLKSPRFCCWWRLWARWSWRRNAFSWLADWPLSSKSDSRFSQPARKLDSQEADFMVPITTLHYLVVAAALFVLGTLGGPTRRNVVIILMSIELILNAVNLNLVAFSRLYGLHGQVFAVFLITDAAPEPAAGLAF